MIRTQIILKNLKDDKQVIVLDEYTTRTAAEDGRKNWRRVLGGKNWTVNRRPGLDTLDHLALTLRDTSNETS